MIWERIFLTALWFLAALIAAWRIGGAVGRGELSAASGVTLIALFYAAVWVIT
jgi:hypothetical protein